MPRHDKKYDTLPEARKAVIERYKKSGIQYEPSPEEIERFAQQLLRRKKSLITK